MANSISQLVAIMKVIPAATDEIQNCHWNVKGSNFDNVHADTGAVYSLLIDWQDIIAERIKGIDPSFLVVKGSCAEVVPITDQRLIVKRVASILEQFNALVKTSIETTDQVTSNQLQTLSYDLDKWIWKFTNSQD